MAPKSLTFVMISTLVVASFSLFGVSTAFKGRKALAPGFDAVALPPDVAFDFVPLNPKNPKVIDLAKYAIDECNKKNNTKLVFYIVFEASYSNSKQGINLRLLVATTNDKKELSIYEVHLFVGTHDKKVTAFKKID